MIIFAALIVARHYLAILAISAAIESAFSITSNIITKNRNSLLLTTVKQLTLSKSWNIKDIKELEQGFILEGDN